MFVSRRLLKLPVLSREARIGFLTYLLLEKKNEFIFNLGRNTNNTVTIVGNFVRQVAHPESDWEYKPLVPGSVNSDEVILQFLMSKLKETNQSCFSGCKAHSEYNHTEYEGTIETSEIDYRLTILYLVHRSNGMGNITLSRGDVRSSVSHDQIVTNVAGVDFSVDVKSLDEDSDNDETTIQCRNAILAEFKRLYPCGYLYCDK